MSEILTHEEALRMAYRVWSGVYLVRRASTGWYVTLHGPKGPQHWLGEDGSIRSPGNPLTAHVDYPHEPWTLYDCPTCENACPHEHDTDDDANDWCVWYAKRRRLEIYPI